MSVTVERVCKKHKYKLEETRKIQQLNGTEFEFYVFVCDFCHDQALMYKKVFIQMVTNGLFVRKSERIAVDFDNWFKPTYRS